MFHHGQVCYPPNINLLTSDGSHNKVLHYNADVQVVPTVTTFTWLSLKADCRLFCFEAIEETLTDSLSHIIVNWRILKNLALIFQFNFRNPFQLTVSPPLTF